MTQATAALRAALSGDAEALKELQGRSADELRAAAGVGPLILTSDAAAFVLRAYVGGMISAADAQRWAEFVRWGRIGNMSGEPTPPLDIEYDPDHEDAIGECVARLDELGDIVDGELRDGEADELLRALDG
jgi:predicted Zn-dependent protease